MCRGRPARLRNPQVARPFPASLSQYKGLVARWPVTIHLPGPCAGRLKVELGYTAQYWDEVSNIGQMRFFASV